MTKRKAGRPRSTDARRWPNGRVVYKPDDARVVVAEARAKQCGVTLTERNMHALLQREMSSEIGRLFLLEQASTGMGVTSEQYDAGVHMWKIFCHYHRAVLGAWPWAQNAAIKMVPEPVEAPDEPDFAMPVTTPEERIKAVTEAYMRLQGALLNAGKVPMQECHDVCVYDQPVRRLTQLRSGLDWVRSEFGMN